MQERAVLWTAPRLDVIGRLWRLFHSLHLLLALLFGIIALTLVGTLVMQAPPEVLGDPLARKMWLLQAQRKYGSLADLLAALDLFNVFNSLLFKGLLGLLTLNVIVCTLNRAPKVWASTRVKVRMPDTFFEKNPHRADLGVRAAAIDATLEAATRALRGQRYRVALERGEGGYHLLAERNRYAKLATFINHLGLVLALGGLSVTGLFGVRDNAFILAEGTTRAIPFAPEVSVHLESFLDEYTPSGVPKDYRSEVVIYDGGREALRGTIRVNQPLEYQGIRLHQAFFGWAAVVQVKRSDGTVLFDQPVSLAFRDPRYGERPVGFFALPSEGLVVDVVGNSGPEDRSILPGQVAMFVYRQSDQERPVTGGIFDQRQPRTWENLELSFQRETRFAGLQAVRDPGVPIMAIAAVLIVGGTMIVFNFPHRKLWLQLTPAGAGTRLRLAAMSARDPGFDQEFARLAAVVERAVPPAVAVADAALSADAPPAAGEIPARW